MGGLFSKPSVPTMPTPPTPAAPPAAAPTIDAAADMQRKQDNNLARKGRAADVLSGPAGDLTAAPVGTKKLLGG